MRLVFFSWFLWSAREKHAKRLFFFPPLVRVRMRILEISPSYLVLRIRDPFGQRMTKGTPGDEVALPYKKQRLLRRIGLL